MDKLLQDLRYAIRSFGKTPGFTALAVLTIGIGIGVNATVFSFVNALLLRPSPGVRDPHSLVSVFTSDFSSGPYGVSSYPDYLSLKSEVSALANLAAFEVHASAATMRADGPLERIRAMSVTGQFFATLGVQPVAGRMISSADETESAPVAVIGYNFWQRAFGGAVSAVGAQITIDNKPMTIIGVAPERFDGVNLGATIELWTLLAGRDLSAGRGNRDLSIVGRLPRGATLRQVQSQLDGVAARLAAAYPESNRGILANPNDPRPMTAVAHTRLHPSFRGEVQMIGAILSVAVGLVLLIACANVAGLLLSRSTARLREVAVRLALGASRGRIVRQTVTESVLLGAIGGAVGLLFALWTADALPSFFPAEQARLLDARVDWSVVAFTSAIALASSLVFGLAPALHGLRSSATTAFRTSGGQVGDARRTISARNLLVVAQVALASVLLVSAALLTRSLANAATADLGFSTRNAVVLSVELPSEITPAPGRAYYQALVDSVSAIPGVESATVARIIPVAGGSRRMFSVPGYVPAQGEDMELHINTVDRHYFATMGMHPLHGRFFDESDAPGAPVVVVNDVFASRYFGGEAVGRRINSGRQGELEVIGVVRVHRRSGIRDQHEPVVFFQLGRDFMGSAYLVARTAGDPRSLADTIRRHAIALDNRVAIFRVTTLEDRLAEAVSAHRLTASLVATCGALAFVLAGVGVYGIVAYAVVRRTREIGLRIALGAKPGQVLSLLAREGGRVVGIGVAAGVALALASTRLLTSLLYGVSPTDVMTFTMVPAAVVTVAMLASCSPALRALRISPVAALRHE